MAFHLLILKRDTKRENTYVLSPERIEGGIRTQILRCRNILDCPDDFRLDGGELSVKPSQECVSPAVPEILELPMLHIST